MTVHLLRHGEVYNPGGILYGRLPGYRLSDLGAAQAKLAAEYLANKNIGYLVSSPLERVLSCRGSKLVSSGSALRLWAGKQRLSYARRRSERGTWSGPNA